MRFSAVIFSEHGVGTLTKGSKVYVIRLERTRGFITQPCRGWVLRECLQPLHNPKTEELLPHTLSEFNPFFRDVSGLPYQVQNLGGGKLPIRANRESDSEIVAHLSEESVVLLSLISENCARISKPIRGWSQVRNDKGVVSFLLLFYIKLFSGNFS